MGITQAPTRLTTPSDRSRLDVTDFRTEQVADYAETRDGTQLFFERKGSRTFLVTES